MKFKKYLLVLLLPLLFIVGCNKSDIDSISKTLNTYTMEIVYNDDHSLDVEQSLTYHNKSENTLDSIKFHLYPRSFREDSKLTVVSSLNYSKCYYKGKSYGDLEINSVSINKTTAEYSIVGNDDILDVKLSNQLSPNESTTINITYKVTIPNINHRFGYGDNTINLGNFYPIVCVYENGEFVTDSYHYNGDPFYSDVANYNVTLTTPSNLTLASTGNILSTTNNESTTTYNINAKVVRDYAFVLSDKFNVVSANIDNIQVNYYYYKNQYPNECLQTSVDSLNTFTKLFGDYPYNTLNVVETNFVHGGMEYPNLVMISDAVDVQSDYINVIVHEIAHQWWYGIVGNDEVKYGWLDEGLTEYSTILFYDNNPSYNVDTKELIKNTTNSFVTFVDVYTQVFGEVDTSMNRALNEYNNESEYVYIAYVKGMLLFDNLKEILGRDKFIKALQTYYKDNRFKISTPDKLIESFEKSTKSNLNELFESWINGKVKIISAN